MRRVEAARRNAAYWTEVDESTFVRRAHWYVNADTDELYELYRGDVFGRDGRIEFDRDRPLVFYVSAGEVVLLERVHDPSTWSEAVQRQTRSERGTAGAR